jgi:hypothetical protein
MSRFICGPCRIKESRLLVLPRTSCFTCSKNILFSAFLHDLKGKNSMELFCNIMSMPITCYVIFCIIVTNEILDSAVGTATGYWLDGRGVGGRVSVWTRFLSSPRRPDSRL